MRSRLRLIDSTEDRGPALERRAVVEVRAPVKAMDGSDPDPEALLAVGRIHWYRARAKSSEGRDLAIAVRFLTPCFALGMQGVPDDAAPHLAPRMDPFVQVLAQRAIGSGAPDDIASLVDLCERTLRATPADQPERWIVVMNLGSALSLRFAATGDGADCLAGVDAYRAALAGAAAGHPGLSELLRMLGQQLLLKFDITRDTADLVAAVEAADRSVDESPLHHPLRPQQCSVRGVARFLLAKHLGDRTGMDGGIDLVRDALRQVHPTSPLRAGIRTQLAAVLLGRCEVAADPASLAEAFDQLGFALLEAPAEPTTLVNLARAAVIRYGLDGDRAALRVATARLEENAARSLSPARRARTLATAGLRLAQRGDEVLRDAAIGLFESAEGSALPGSWEQYEIQGLLGGALMGRWLDAGDSADLVAALTTLRGEQWCPPDGGAADEEDPVDVAALLTVSGAGAALPGVVLEEVGRSVHHSLAAGRIAERTGSAEGLDEAIDHLDTLLSLLPAGPPARATILSNRGNQLAARFGSSGDPADLDAAVASLTESLGTAPPGDFGRPARLRNLGCALLDRFWAAGDPADVRTAVGSFEQALTLLPAHHSQRGATQYDLAVALVTRAGHEHLGDGLRAGPGDESPGPFPAQSPEWREAVVDHPDSDRALTLWTAVMASQDLTPQLRIRAGFNASQLTRDTDPALAADTLELTVALLSDVVPRSLHRADQLYRLLGIGDGAVGLASQAAALALAVPGTGDRERTLRALRLLETGRGVLLHQTLHTRGDLTDLRRRNAALAERFALVRERLDDTRMAFDEPPDEPPSGSPDAADLDRLLPRLPDRRALAAELASLVAAIRAEDGHASFAVLPGIDDLLATAAAGPVVVINVGQQRSDALLITAGGVSSVRLTALTAQETARRVLDFQTALRAAADPEADRKAAQGQLRHTLAWLWDVLAEPVLTALGLPDGPPDESGAWPRVWWVPGSLLANLPLHAAGHHDDPADAPVRRTVLDRVVSSYAPTLTSLRHVRLRTGRPTDGLRSLIVSMPTTPGLPDEGRLGHAAAEAAVLRATLPRPVLLAASVPGVPADGPPTRAALLARLRESEIAHVACHAVNDPWDPAGCRLLLHDHREAPLTVADLEPVLLDQARLAYLSACETAAAGPTSAWTDESVNLVSAFQLAGFPHVVGTLWPVRDDIAVRIARTFYAGLGPDGRSLDPDRAALALHHAVRAVRARYPRTPWLWAGYLHVGA
ncbi:CHAT domain-containing protein [Streptomyces sp. SL13]|uniref:CHAT domain-containing protein n=1 Tax=Streptantibioticus silvisoli TaxID=2705255 RepID=A0AA90K8G4_9ACTN|nr:CHAT domain-containing protein [Streptantibioticus silvisoli]MDI5969417.1 CHAT domain-containing protein [Streptantibioticus silvisoli]